VHPPGVPMPTSGLPIVSANGVQLAAATDDRTSDGGRILGMRMTCGLAVVDTIGGVEPPCDAELSSTPGRGTGGVDCGEPAPWKPTIAAEAIWGSAGVAS